MVRCDEATRCAAGHAWNDILSREIPHRDQEYSLLPFAIIRRIVQPVMRIHDDGVSFCRTHQASLITI